MAPASAGRLAVQRSPRRRRDRHRRHGDRPGIAHAQPTARTLRPANLVPKDSIAARPLVLVGALGALSLLPFVIIMVTSFVKISVVLSIVRSALGTQQMPPTQVITGLATILTVYIMTPVGLEIYREAES